MCLAGFLHLQENVSLGTLLEYFDKYYDTAINIYLFGTGTGIIVSPLVTQMFLDIYGWRGAMLMLCGMNMQSIICGTLITGSHSNIKRQKEIEYHPIHQEEASDYSKLKDKHLNVRRIFKEILNTFDVKLLARPSYLARVFLPVMSQGYIIISWVIYIVSFALSNGATLKESATVATLGGVGIVIIRLAVPILNSIMTYRLLLYISSFGLAISLVLTTLFTSITGMSVCSLCFGLSFGILGTEIYIATKDVVQEDEYYNAISWSHLAYGVASVVSATLTGECTALLYTCGRCVREELKAY